jgi:hypothetical protein
VAYKPLPWVSDRLVCTELNEVTWKVTGKHKAWLLGLGHGQWLVRCGPHSCGPEDFDDARRMAIALANGAGVIDDFTSANPQDHSDRLNRLQAKATDDHCLEMVVDRSPALEARYQSYLRRWDEQRLIAPTESVELEHNGYPELPSFLDRRPSRMDKAA